MSYTLSPALFLDRDGTVIEDRHYLHDPEGVCLFEGAGEALGRLCAAGWELYVVTNQSGIGRGYFREEDFFACQRRLEELLLQHGAKMTAFRHCPHDPAEDCPCRKPRTGMWESLKEACHLDPSACVMVGDKIEDLLFGVNAGFSAAVLVLTGKGADSAEKMGWSLPEGADAVELVWPSLPEGLSAVHPENTRLLLARDLPSLARVLLKA